MIKARLWNNFAVISDNLVIVEVESLLGVPGLVLVEPDVELVNLLDIV